MTTDPAAPPAAPARTEADVAAALASHGTTVAYQVGQKFRGYVAQPAEPLAQIFERHGFVRSARELRRFAGDSRAALTTVISRRGKTKLNAAGTRASRAGVATEFSLGVLRTDSPDVKSWGVYRHERREGEQGRTTVYGARVYATPDGLVHAADPVLGAPDAAPDAACRAIAEDLADEARSLLVNAESADLSDALTHAYQDAGAFSFLAAGSYVVPAGEPGTARLLALVADMAAYWDEQRWCGVRVRTAAVTQADAPAFGEAIVDDVAARVGELIEQLREYTSRGADKRGPSLGTLARRRDEAAAILDDIGRQQALIGGWTERFAAQASELRAAFESALNGADLGLPAWADEAGDTDGAPVAPVPVIAVATEPAAEATPPAAPTAPPEPARPAVVDPDLEAFEL